DALDLAAVFEVAGDVGLVHVQGLAFQPRRQLRPRLAALACLFLLLLLGLDPLLLLALGADRVGLGEVDLLAAAPGLALLARPALARPLAGTIAPRRPAVLAPPGGRLALGLGCLETQPQQLVTQ